MLNICIQCDTSPFTLSHFEFHTFTLSHLHFHTFTLTLSYFHFHTFTFTFTLSLSHFHFHTFTSTLSLSHFHFHTFNFTLSLLHFYNFTCTLSLTHFYTYMLFQSSGCCNHRDGSRWTFAQLRFRVGRPRSSGGRHAKPPSATNIKIFHTKSVPKSVPKSVSKSVLKSVAWENISTLLLVSLDENNTCIQSKCNCRSYDNLCVLTKLSMVKYFSSKWHQLPKCHQNGALEEI